MGRGGLVRIGGRYPAATLCGLLLAAGCGAGGQAGGAVRGSVQVALVGVFSGQGASRGSYQQNSLQVEIDDINAHGGLLGNRVALVTADDEQQPAKAAELVRQHVSDDGVKLLVGPSTAAAFLAARSTIVQAGAPNCLPNPATD